MEISFRSLSSSSACLSALLLTAGAVRRPPAALGRPRAPSCVALASTRRLEGPCRHPSCSAGLVHARHAAQNHLAVATSPSPWPGQDTPPELDFSHAAAIQVPQRASSLVLLPIPHSQSSERCCRPYPRRRAHPRRRTASLLLLRPQLTPPVALPRPCATLRPNPALRPPPEPPRRRSRAPPPPSSPRSRHCSPAPPKSTLPRASHTPTGAPRLDPRRPVPPEYPHR